MKALVFLLAACGVAAVACQPAEKERRQVVSPSQAPVAADAAQPAAGRPQPGEVAAAGLPSGPAAAPAPGFAQARASSLYTGKPAAINYRSHAIARHYRTVLTAGYQEGGVNFGGHYCFVTWMCGASCTQSALVDARNGRVYEGPIAPAGFSFRADSRLLVINPPDSSGATMPYFPTEYWVWHEAHRQFERP